MSQTKSFSATADTKALGTSDPIADVYKRQIFGSKPCFKSTYECMHAIAPETLARTVEQAADL